MEAMTAKTISRLLAEHGLLHAHDCVERFLDLLFLAVFFLIVCIFAFEDVEFDDEEAVVG